MKAFFPLFKWVNGKRDFHPRQAADSIAITKNILIVQL